MTSLFERDRIRFTTISTDDIAQLAKWMADFGLQRLVNPGMSFPTDVDDFLDPEGWFQTDLESETSHIFAVRTRTDNRFIGTCAIVGLNMFTHCAEIGINLAHPDYRGKGYGRETMTLMMRYGFEQLNLNRIYLRVMSFNTRAIHLYERLGFQHEVRKREAVFHDGYYYDLLLMGMLRSEWEAIYG